MGKKSLFSTVLLNNSSTSLVLVLRIILAKRGRTNGLVTGKKSSKFYSSD